MKKILAVVLTVLMLLPMFASIAFASLQIPEDADKINVANKATIKALDTFDQGVRVDLEEIDPTTLIDGDRETGTNSPEGQYYSYELTYEDTYYFTDVVIACNLARNSYGTLATGEVVTRECHDLYALMVVVYYGNEVAYTSDIYDVSNLTEVTIPVNVKGDRIEVRRTDGAWSDTEYMWEIETIAVDMEICSAQVENVASQAIFSATGANANYWWAMNYKTWVDGDPTTGSRSPKGRNYSVWMHFPQEYLFSQIDLVCNTEGGSKLIASTGQVDSVNERYFGNAMMRVLVYNYNEDLIWDSDMIDTSTTTTLSVSPYVEGAIIEIRFFNGNFGGGEYMYEVSAYAQSGDHVFEKVSEENPGCLTPGYQELACQCGKVIKQAIPATGFHKWEEEEITKVPTTTENGVLSIGCTGCDSVKLYDIPSTGHNWDSGTKYVPTLCDEQGYTLYKCTDEGCGLTYKADYIEAKEHTWGEGVITKKPTVTEEGVITYKCDVCGGEKYGRIRKHKYTDSTAPFTSASIKDYKVVINENPGEGFGKYNPDSYVDVDPAAMFDGDIYGSYWYGPAGTYVDVILDKAYVFTSGLFYASANWSSMKIEFYLGNDIVMSNPETEKDNPGYSTGNVNTGVDPSNPQECDMYDYLKVGIKADRIRITTVTPKWENGQACKLQELKLVAHSCKISEEDYIKDSNYKAPVCGTDGSCNAKCQVCEVVSKVTIPATSDNSHTLGEISSIVPATCLTDGVGSAICTTCNTTVNDITIPATGAHEYTKDVVSVTAKCGFAGVGQKVCKYCDKVGSIYEIAPTGIHEYEWATKSQASYTAVGKTEYCCVFCDQLDPNTEKNVDIAEKLPIPDGLVQFVGKKAETVNGRNTLSFTYKIDLSLLPELEKTCDVRIITTIKDAQGREASIESYGKYAAENSYNAETGEFTVTIYPSSLDDAFEVSTAARLMNFRGVVYRTYVTDTYTSK